MGHFLVLLPLLIIASAFLHRAYKKDPDNLYAHYFRNFAVAWTGCTLVGATAVVVGGTVYAQLMGAAFSLPLHYFASAYLVLLAFALYKKHGFLPKFIVGVIIAAGLFIGSVILFSPKVLNLFGELGPLTAVYKWTSAHFAYVRLGVLSGILIPLGLFFLSESFRAVSKRVRVRALLIGLGTIVIGIFGGVHVFLGPVPLEFNVHWADLVVPLGFLLVFIGLVYGKTPSGIDK
ncbi:MAG: hypothetical protein HY455_01200 [Parcubacteria group bacterium]|nr:hypothetical protein [Parcubacteria group bacterium]